MTNGMDAVKADGVIVLLNPKNGHFEGQEKDRVVLIRLLGGGQIGTASSFEGHIKRLLPEDI